jgi:4-amino-4-deoxy-L-arabinose transferase-like glycosyltransferase
MRPAAALIIICTIVCALGLALRLPMMVQPMGIDQGIFTAAAWGMSQGDMLYRGLWDQKPPGIHLLYRAAIALFGPHETTVFWMDFLAAVTTTALLGVVGWRLARPAAGLAAAVIYAVLGLPTVRYGAGGFLERAVPETFIPVCVLAGAALLLSRRRGTRAFLIAGVCFGCAALLKPTALIYWLAMLIAIPRAEGPQPGEWKHLLVWTAAGIAAPLLIVFLWLWNGGALHDAWVAVVDYNRAYVGVGATLWQFADRFVHEVWRLTKTDPLWLVGMASLVVAAIGWRIERRLDWAVVAGWLWLTASIVAAAANGTRVYSTYFQQCLPALAFVAGVVAAGHSPAAARARWRYAALAAVLVIGAWRVQKAAVIERVSAALTADLGQWRAAPRDEEARLRYLERFGSYAAGRGFSARANAELSDFLAVHRLPNGSLPNGQRIYIFGMAPGVYFTSRLMPAQRFLWIGPAASNLLPDPSFTLDTVAADLERTRPGFIILERNNRDSLLGWRAEERFTVPAMRRVLEQYDQVAEIEDFVLYRRR